MKRNTNYVLGADFGSDSVRVVVIDAADGKMAGSGVSNYKRWSEGKYCDPKLNQFRQHPLDYIESFEEAVKKAAQESGEAMEKIRALCIDTTGSTPALCDASGTPSPNLNLLTT